MVNSNNAFLREEYISRINKVQDYIEANISEELSLAVLSGVANFSQFHFHRIFCSIIGEPPSKYLQRIRLERAALSIIGNPKETIAEIALKFGFSNQASFSRAFMKHFGFSASQLRADIDILKSKKCKVESKNGKDDLKSFTYNGVVSAEAKVIQEMPVIYIRNTGMFKGEPQLFRKLLDKLFGWANARGLIDHNDTKILSLYHDNYEITDQERFRTSICLTINGDTAVDGEIGKMTIPGGRYAIGHCILDASQFPGAWNFIGEWLSENGYQPDDRPCFEIYLNNPDEHPEKKSIVDLYIPVKPL